MPKTLKSSQPCFPSLETPEWPLCLLISRRHSVLYHAFHAELYILTARGQCKGFTKQSLETKEDVLKLVSKANGISHS